MLCTLSESLYKFYNKVDCKSFMPSALECSTFVQYDVIRSSHNLFTIVCYTEIDKAYTYKYVVCQFSLFTRCCMGCKTRIDISCLCYWSDIQERSHVCIYHMQLWLDEEMQLVWCSIVPIACLPWMFPHYQLETFQLQG